MKLHELGAQRQTDQISKTMAQRLGNQVRFDRIHENHARGMLQRVRGLLNEYRSSPSRHYSERNPDYLRLMMMEQALEACIREQAMQPGSQASPASMAAATDPKTKAVMDKARRGQTLSADEQATMNKIALAKEEQVNEKYMGFEKLEKSIAKRGDVRDPGAVAAAIGRKKYGKAKFQKAAAAGKKLGESRLTESEIQTAQVVLAAQDMIDRLQGMMEDISEMQFKDLPALTDSIKNDMGVEQSQQFQQQASAALTELLAAVQAGKATMEGAQGVLTGQAPTVPGDMGTAPTAPVPADSDIEADLDLDANLPNDEDEEEEVSVVGLGRERR
jgi:hypothetical protein